MCFHMIYLSQVHQHFVYFDLPPPAFLPCICTSICTTMLHLTVVTLQLKNTTDFTLSPPYDRTYGIVAAVPSAVGKPRSLCVKWVQKQVYLRYPYKRTEHETHFLNAPLVYILTVRAFIPHVTSTAASVF